MHSHQAKESSAALQCSLSPYCFSSSLTGPPTVTITPGDRITAIVGERVNIECVGEGDPTPTVFWRSDTRRRSDILPEAYEPAPGTAGLIFDPVGVSDSGRYTCVARNDRGTTEENVDLSGETGYP